MVAVAVPRVRLLVPVSVAVRGRVMRGGVRPLATRRAPPGAVGGAALPMSAAMDGSVGFAAVLGGDAHGSFHDWRAPPSHSHWLHLQLTHDTEAWLLNRGRIDPIAFRALVA